jgi:hypothetical protein
MGPELGGCTKEEHRESCPVHATPSPVSPALRISLTNTLTFQTDLRAIGIGKTASFTTLPFMYILFPSQLLRPRLGRHALEAKSKVLGINASERRVHHHSCNPERLVVNVNTPM